MEKEAEEIDNLSFDITVFVVYVCVWCCLRCREGGCHDQYNLRD